ncbi:MAG: HAMP domain-containing protein, partial [Elusimicrobiota bacterium]|nr:HAMP domain-containing protein [Elusimicrobiota bacterium]
MKIRAKLFLLLLPPLLLSGLLINYLTGRAVCTTLHEETAAGVAAGAARLLDSSSPDFLASREDKLLPFLYNLKTSLNAGHACFVDTGGTILAHTDVLQKGKKLPGARSAEFLSPEGGYGIAAHSARNFMEVYIPVKERRADSPEELALLGAAADAKRLGTLVVFSPLKGVIETENYIARKSAAILAAVYLAILFTVFFLASLALRPIHQLIAGTKRIRLGDYNTLIPVTSRDEFGELAGSFNEMSRTLSGTIVSKEYLNTILDNMADTLLVVDLNGIIKKTNRAAGA